MWAIFLMAFRECMEATLVLAPILVLLNFHNKRDLSKNVFFGAGLSLLITTLIAFGLFYTVLQLDEAARQVFEGGMMLFVSALIGYFVISMDKKFGAGSSGVSTNIANASSSAVFLIAFLTVFKEALEMIVFILTKVSENATSLAAATGFGVLTALLFTVLLYKVLVRLNISLIFMGLNLALIIIGAATFGEGLVTLMPAGGESLEMAGTLVYGIPGVFLYLKKNIKSYLKKLKG